MPHVTNTIKYSRLISIISNAIVLLCGIALLTLGIFIEVSDDFIAIYNITQALGGENMLWVGVMMIIVGVLGMVLLVEIVSVVSSLILAVSIGHLSDYEQLT